MTVLSRVQSCFPREPWFWMKFNQAGYAFYLRWCIFWRRTPQPRYAIHGAFWRCASVLEYDSISVWMYEIQDKTYASSSSGHQVRCIPLEVFKYSCVKGKKEEEEGRPWDGQTHQKQRDNTDVRYADRQIGKRICTEKDRFVHKDEVDKGFVKLNDRAPLTKTHMLTHDKSLVFRAQVWIMRNDSLQKCSR